MAALIDSILKIFADEIGLDDKCKYLHFEPDAGYSDTRGHFSDSTIGQIAYEKDNQVHFSRSIFLKIITDSSNATLLGRIPLPKGILTTNYINEKLFYTIIYPYFQSIKRVDHMIPQFFGTIARVKSDVFSAVLIFENLLSTGYVPCKLENYLDFAHLSLIMKNLGVFHAYSIEARRIDTSTYFSLCSLFSDVVSSLTLVTQSVLIGRFKLALKFIENDTRYLAVRKKANEILENFQDFIMEFKTTDINSPLTVFCHRACKADNIMFRYNGNDPIQLKLLDWQTCHFASLAVDILVVLYLNADQETRDKYWDNLIDVYYSSLNETFGNEVPSKESIYKDIKRLLPIVFLVIPQRFMKPPGDLSDRDGKIIDPAAEVIKDSLYRFLE
ncbi:hypothetical protein PGB90_009034 [Kerria lacca]